jgi:hypothetical protein
MRNLDNLVGFLGKEKLVYDIEGNTNMFLAILFAFEVATW